MTDTNSQQENTTDTDRNPYSHVPSKKQALLSPWTWIGGVIILASITGPMFVFDSPVVAGQAAVIGFIGALLSQSVLQRTKTTD